MTSRADHDNTALFRKTPLSGGASRGVSDPPDWRYLTGIIIGNRFTGNTSATDMLHDLTADQMRLAPFSTQEKFNPTARKYLIAEVADGSRGPISLCDSVNGDQIVPGKEGPPGSRSLISKLCPNVSYGYSVMNR